MTGGVILAPLAAAYGAIVGARAALYRKGWLRSERAPSPVISIGNLVAGGTGKTPVAALVAGILREAGLKPAIVSRGYLGRRKQDPLIVSEGGGPLEGITADLAGDEPVMLARLVEEVPVVVARRRIEGARAAVQRLGARSLVLDDGFQHLALMRDLDIVLLDAFHPFDEGRLLPAGTLRERPAALARCDAVVITGFRGADAGHVAASGGLAPARLADLGPVRALARPATPIFRVSMEPTLVISARETSVPGRSGPESLCASWICAMRVVAFAGIAQPHRFVQDIRRLGAEVVSFFGFGDHHRYTDADVARIMKAARRLESEVLLTTEKDVARLRGTPQIEPLIEEGLVALRVEATLPPEERAPFRDLVIAAASGGRNGGGARA